MTAQGKTEGRHPGLSLPLIFLRPWRGRTNKFIEAFCAAPTGRKKFFGESHTQGGGLRPYSGLSCVALSGRLHCHIKRQNHINAVPFDSKKFTGVLYVGENLFI